MVIIFKAAHGDMGIYDYFAQCPKCNSIQKLFDHVSHIDFDLIIKQYNIDEYIKLCCVKFNPTNLINENNIFNAMIVGYASSNFNVINNTI